MGVDGTGALLGASVATRTTNKNSDTTAIHAKPVRTICSLFSREMFGRTLAVTRVRR
jgi:hypothetical protein